MEDIKNKEIKKTNKYKKVVETNKTDNKKKNIKSDNKNKTTKVTESNKIKKEVKTNKVDNKKIPSKTKTTTKTIKTSKPTKTEKTIKNTKTIKTNEINKPSKTIKPEKNITKEKNIKQEKNIKSIIFTIILIIISLLFMFGLSSYALFNINLEGLTNIISKTPIISLTYEEPPEALISDSFGLSTQEGKIQNNYFEFTIKASSSIEYEMSYRIYMTGKDTNTLKENEIYAYLTEVDEGNEIELMEPTLLSDFIDHDLDYSKTLLTSSFNWNNEDINTLKSKTYRLRMWSSTTSDIVTEEDGSQSLVIGGGTYEYSVHVEAAEYKLFKIVQNQTLGTDVANNINYSAVSSDTNGKGVYTLSSTANDEYPVHFYRGNVDNNNVVFANYCWKIVRTTETGGTKLIFNGELKEDGSCNNIGAETYTEAVRYYSSIGSIEYIGYSFPDVTTSLTYVKPTKITAGTVFGKDVEYENGVYTLIDTITPTYDSTSSTAFKDYAEILSNYHYTCSTTSASCPSVRYYYMARATNTNLYYITLNQDASIEKLLERVYKTGSTNKNKSLVHQKVESWYSTNMTNYDSYLEDTVWCNDRSIGEPGGWQHTNNIYEPDTSDVTMKLQFGSFTRILNGKPSIICENPSDRFTKLSSNGNGNLLHSAGLITADEAMLAGYVWWLGNDENYLYNNGQNGDTFWWTMSPSYISVNNGYIVIGYDMLDGIAINYNGIKIGVRPAISLKYGVTIERGKGTINNPYIVHENMN